MLDVHAPHQSPLGIRDFFIHLLTITIGLLIALGLEAGAEAVHHRHQRIEAESTIRLEIEANRKKLLDMQPGMGDEHKNLLAALHYLEARRDGKPANATGISLGFRESPLRNTAWQTALSTGIVSYMDYDKVQVLSGAYQEQQLFQASEERALEHLEQLDPYISNIKSAEEVSDKDAVDAIPVVRLIIADLAAMHDVGVGTIGAYDDALKR
jgi:hypothetical protein